MRRGAMVGVLVLLTLVLGVGPAAAFCGFFVGRADVPLVNDTTTVVLMRGGQRTVLSMQNSYKGPVEDFAMVIPVPVVLAKESVRTLPPEIFARVVELTSPRLVEYHEADPCPPEADESAASDGAGNMVSMARPHEAVRVEARFTVAEYDFVVLGADDSLALEAWLRGHGYRIPEGAAPYLKPYVALGNKFLVAKVDVHKVRFEGNEALLSPLRFHFDTDRFVLPIRLGLINSAGTQDLLVHVIALDRYEAANYENALIPTNIDVKPGAKEHFTDFYAALLDRAFERHPGAVITEYSWRATSCDPCTAPPLSAEDVATLGGDVVPEVNSETAVVTRLHARYRKDDVGEDLVFRAAPPIVGGREFGRNGRLEHGAEPSSYNAFQARYAIRKPWSGAIACSQPIRGAWEEPNEEPLVASRSGAPSGSLALADWVAHDVPELGVRSDGPLRAYAGEPPGMRGCASCAARSDAGSASWLGWLLLGGVTLLRRRTR